MRDRRLRALQKKYLSPKGRPQSLHILRQVVPQNDPDYHLLQQRIKKPRRQQSGVIPLTILMPPHPCPGRCIFCPSDIRAPKSYLAHEPGVQRALHLDYDPVLQVYQRLNTLQQAGQQIHKIEVIILGGTFTSYPKTFQTSFVERIVHALNHFSPSSSTAALTPLFKRERDLTSTYHVQYNRAVSQVPKEKISHVQLLEKLGEAHRLNEQTTHRCVGLSIETRPDHVTKDTLEYLRALGVTKVQIGIQHTSSKILADNLRDHTHEETLHAVRLLKRFGFKVQGHWMPNLLGATPEIDQQGYAQLHQPNDCMPDELKIYPCVLLPKTGLETHYQAGRWAPYSTDVLQRVLHHHIIHTPRWTRLSRIVRDIDQHASPAQAPANNLRQKIESGMVLNKEHPLEIRAREATLADSASPFFCLEAHRVDSHIGEHIFVEATTAEHGLLGFCRLFLPALRAPITELNGCALIRELHVYGSARSLKSSLTDSSLPSAQHTGVGECLLQFSERLAQDERFTSIAVISSIGTRNYYRKRGFRDGRLYQYKKL